VSNAAIISRVASWDDGEAVYVASLPRGPIAVLDGPAAVIWRAFVAGNRETTASRVAEAAGVGPDDVRPAVEEFLSQLDQAGLLPRG
jgi:hypothetical protein